MASRENYDAEIDHVVDETIEVHYGNKKDFRTALPQFLAVSVKNLLLISYGMTLGFQTILIPAVQDPKEDEVLHLNTSEISWISSLNLVVVPIGCALSGILTTPIGRRRAMQMVNIPFVAAWLIFHFSTTTEHLYGGLCLTGLAGGLLEAPVLTYVAEITQPHLRGAFTATSSMCIIIGVFTQFVFGIFFYWRTVTLINIIFSILAFVTLCFIPESPHWLVSRKRHDDARKSLQWLRGWTGPQQVEEELKDIQALFKIKEEAHSDEESFTKKMSFYLDKSFMFPFFIVSLAFFVGHFSGMTTLQVYAVSIFEMLEAPLEKYYATLILGLLQIIGACTCVLLVHCIGKRPLTFVSTAGAGACCMLLALYDGLYIKRGSNSSLEQNSSSPDVNASIFANFTSDANNITTENDYSVIPTTLLLLLAFISHTGIRLMPWILIGEVFSARTRSGGAGLSSAVGYIFNFLSNKMYLSLVGNLSIWGTYGLYGIICVTGCILLYFILPETEGRTLNEIQNHFSGVKRLSNGVYRSNKFRSQNNDASITGTKMKELQGKSNPSFVECIEL